MPAEQTDSLWTLIAAPLIWCGYFLSVYVAAAIRCASAESPMAHIFEIRILVAVLGILSLVAICGIGVSVWRQLRRNGPILGPHDDDTAQSRGQFLALATLLLCGISIVATVYVALPALFIASCR